MYIHVYVYIYIYIYMYIGCRTAIAEVEVRRRLQAHMLPYTYTYTHMLYSTCIIHQRAIKNNSYSYIITDIIIFQLILLIIAIIIY